MKKSYNAKASSSYEHCIEVTKGVIKVFEIGDLVKVSSSCMSVSFEPLILLGINKNTTSIEFYTVFGHMPIHVSSLDLTIESIETSPNEHTANE